MRACFFTTCCFSLIQMSNTGLLKTLRAHLETERVASHMLLWDRGWVKLWSWTWQWPQASQESRSGLGCNTPTKRPFCCLQHHRGCHLKQMLAEVSWETEHAILFFSQYKQHAEILLHFLLCFHRDEKGRAKRKEIKKRRWLTESTEDHEITQVRAAIWSAARHKDTSFLSFSKKRKKVKKHKTSTQVCIKILYTSKFRGRELSVSSKKQPMIWGFMQRWWVT